MQESSGIPHGSAAMVPDQRTMVAARAESPLGPLTASNDPAAAASLDATIHTPPDVSLSDSSLGLTPPKPRTRGRSGSTGLGTTDRKARSRIQLGVRRAASSGTKRHSGVPRLPSPMVAQSRVASPTVVPTTNASPEARLAALEQQRLDDHAIMRQMADAIANLRNVVEHTTQKSRAHDNAIEEQMRLGLDVRRELAAGRNQPVGNATVDDVAAICEAKFGQLDALIQQLNAQDANVAAVVQAEHDKSKDLAGKDGTLISGAFDAMDKKLSHVSELVRKFDNGIAATGIPAGSAVFTHAMDKDMRRMHDKM